MADSGNQKVSHAAEPSNQIAGIGAVVVPTQSGYATKHTFFDRGRKFHPDM